MSIQTHLIIRRFRGGFTEFQDVSLSVIYVRINSAWSVDYNKLDLQPLAEITDRAIQGHCSQNQCQIQPYSSAILEWGAKIPPKIWTPRLKRQPKCISRLPEEYYVGAAANKSIFDLSSNCVTCACSITNKPIRNWLPAALLLRYPVWCLT